MSSTSQMSRPLLLTAMLGAVGVPFLCVIVAISRPVDSAKEESQVEMAVLNEVNWDRFVPNGKEVDAIYGDVVLRNKHLTAVIADVVPTRKANMTVRDVAGCLIDLTSRSNESDQLSCFYPGKRLYPFRKRSFQQNDQQGQSLETETEVRSDRLSLTVVSEGNNDRPTVEAQYALGKEDKSLTLTVTYRNDSEKAMTVSLADDIRADGGKEDMTKSPNGNHSIFTIEDHYWQQSYGVRCQGRAIQANSNSRVSTLDYIDAEGSSHVEIPPGESVQRVCHIACGTTRMHVTAALAGQESPPSRMVALKLQDGFKRTLDHARVEVRQGTKLLGVGRSDDEGRLSFPLPEGAYDLQISYAGYIADDSAPLTVTDVDKQSADIICTSYRPGTITVETVGTDKTGLPCKIQFDAVGEGKAPDFGPESADFGVKNLRYAPHGKVSQDLPEGKYEVTISHGPEFDALTETVEVLPGQNTPIHATLNRSVDTTGWVSSDFHSHSSPSGDNTSSQKGRVLNLVCEHIEFAPCTEHNRIETYQEHIDALQIGEFISSVSGMELTGSPLPLNHQNVFPLHHHPHHQDGGGPQTDSDVERQVQRIAAWDDGSEKLIQQNHPDIGWLVYDKNGDGQPDGGHADGVALLDVMEIHPIQKLLTLSTVEGVSESAANGNRLFRWLQLLNQGYRIPGVVNTDAHYNFHGSGWLRNWIQSSTDDPAKIDHMEMVHASEEGRVVMSNGPFLKVMAKEKGSDKQVTVGQDLSAPSKKVELEISVQCPNWMDIDTVFVLVNGRADKKLLFTRKTHADRFSDQTTKFRQKVIVALEGDAHLIVGAGDSDSTMERIFGEPWGKIPPSALTNPIFVDVDGNGFTPNKDTLGLPLPVKGK